MIRSDPRNSTAQTLVITQVAHGFSAYQVIRGGGGTVWWYEGDPTPTPTTPGWVLASRSDQERGLVGWILEVLDDDRFRVVIGGLIDPQTLLPTTYEENEFAPGLWLSTTPGSYNTSGDSESYRIGYTLPDGRVLMVQPAQSFEPIEPRGVYNPSGTLWIAYPSLSGTSPAGSSRVYYPRDNRATTDIVGGMWYASATVGMYPVMLTPGTVGQVLTMANGSGLEAGFRVPAWTTMTAATVGAVPTSRTITAGAGLTGGGDLTADRTLALAASGVAAGSYGSASTVGTFTVDTYGRLTSAGTVTITPAAIGAVPTTRTITAGTGLTGGGDLTANRTLALATSGVTAGSYGSGTAIPVITVDTYGRITAASTAAINTAPDTVLGISSLGYVRRTGTNTYTTDATIPGAAVSASASYTVDSTDTTDTGAFFGNAAWPNFGYTLYEKRPRYNAKWLKGAPLATNVGAVDGSSTADLFLWWNKTSLEWDTFKMWNPTAVTGWINCYDSTVSDTSAKTAGVMAGTALSVFGRASNTDGLPASIAAGTDHQVMRRSGTTIGFGAIALNQSAATTGTLPANRGGTGISAYAVGDLIYASATTTLDRIAAGTNGQILTYDTSLGRPKWASGPTYTFTTSTTAPTGSAPVGSLHVIY